MTSSHVQRARLCRTDNKRIVIADRNTHSLDDLLRQAALMITDYSSVAFDFAYMRKPIIYYQFDKNVFDVEYGGSYFSHERDGFGPVVTEKEECILKIADWMDKRFDLDGIYIDRCERVFPYYDKGNCERIYSAIKDGK